MLLLRHCGTAQSLRFDEPTAVTVGSLRVARSKLRAVDMHPLSDSIFLAAIRSRFPRHRIATYLLRFA